ncbi:MAG: hypothetical protein ABIP39_04705 [Polyangiaceae bacterium]
MMNANANLCCLIASLAERARDASEGFRLASEQLTRPADRLQMKRFGAKHASHARVLADLAPREDGACTKHERRLVIARSRVRFVAKRGDHAIFKALRTSEGEIGEAFIEALSRGLAIGTHALLESLFIDVACQHAWLDRTAGASSSAYPDNVVSLPVRRPPSA